MRPVTSIEVESGALWDVTRSALQRGDVFDGMEHLAGQLGTLRAALPPEAWAAVTREFLAHPLRELVHAGPLTRSAFVKSRGYAGDATTLDFIYGVAPWRPAGPFEEALYRWEYQTHSCRGVRARRDWLAAEIDRAAALRPGARMLSIACGHLREASLSEALRDGRVGELIAFDQDRQSLAEVRSAYGSLAVRTFEGSVRGLLAGRYELGRFDFVYSAGLYDYLALPIARRLTANLFRHVAAGGRLLLANFAPSLPDIGYLETCMDWRLIYRAEADLAAMVDEIPSEAIGNVRMYRDSSGHIVFIAVDRR
jgi:extracellular factor (EF) 3-hydroxypalmitic acid methyl ester biosynthesis protein